MKGSVNPVLEMELINDGRYDFQKSLLNDALQDSVVTFNMKSEETGILKISQANANIVLANEDSCQERYILQYKWKERDVKQEGTFYGWFEIKFNGNLTSDGVDYPKGERSPYYKSAIDQYLAEYGYNPTYNQRMKIYESMGVAKKYRY